nr:PREDICTED: ejaculatory bulb-specific protein 3-like [Bemisia tabaci]WUR09779.1 ejaculatory bulb protein 5 [Bemisia tabaci]
MRPQSLRMTFSCSIDIFLIVDFFFPQRDAISTNLAHHRIRIKAVSPSSKPSVLQSPSKSVYLTRCCSSSIMNFLSVVVLVCCLFAAVLSAPAEFYTSQFDNIDIESILNNEKLLDNYFKCLMDEGPCTLEGRTLKSLVPDALNTSCAKCTDKQKQIARRVITFYLDKYPANSARIIKKYDPENKFKDGIEKALLGSR